MIPRSLLSGLQPFNVIVKAFQHSKSQEIPAEQEKAQIVAAGHQILHTDARRAVTSRESYTGWIKTFSPFDIEKRPSSKHPNWVLGPRVNTKENVLAQAWISAGGKFTTEEMAQMAAASNIKISENESKSKTSFGDEKHGKKDTSAPSSVPFSHLDQDSTSHATHSQLRKPSNEDLLSLLGQFLDDDRIVSCLQYHLRTSIQRYINGEKLKTIVVDVAYCCPEIQTHPHGYLFVLATVYLLEQFGVWLAFIASDSVNMCMMSGATPTVEAKTGREKEKNRTRGRGEKGEAKTISTSEKCGDLVHSSEGKNAAASLSNSPLPSLSSSIPILERIESFEMLDAAEIADEIDEDEKIETMKLRKEIAEWMQKELENKMINFKRKFPTSSFELFAHETFPENCTINPDGSVAVCKRLSEVGVLWTVIKSSDKLHKLGPLPGSK
eukprot:CAMPEP_0185255580 /NCGR_PEP_ID=MMETSP1359-20130426/4642_1 /TAXON_ID=552665 /ORGANISM="Bigelowiella longifila, Strain CCMP242" /LENGTH=438 /DNA_ID=CAMNT_0027839613 /DNA_START=18 /DNA_END=1334 /DNA_ORIENTATION=-